MGVGGTAPRPLSADSPAANTHSHMENNLVIVREIHKSWSSCTSLGSNSQYGHNDLNEKVKKTGQSLPRHEEWYYWGSRLPWLCTPQCKGFSFFKSQLDKKIWPVALYKILDLRDFFSLYGLSGCGNLSSVFWLFKKKLYGLVWTCCEHCGAMESFVAHFMGNDWFSWIFQPSLGSQPCHDQPARIYQGREKWAYIV